MVAAILSRTMAPWALHHQKHKMVCIFLGASVPFILEEEQDHFKVVGECYVQGAMRGEVISSLEISDKTAEESGSHLEQFVLQ